MHYHAIYLYWLFWIIDIIIFLIDCFQRIDISNIVIIIKILSCIYIYISIYIIENCHPLFNGGCPLFRRSVQNWHVTATHLSCVLCYHHIHFLNMIELLGLALADLFIKKSTQFHSALMTALHARKPN